MVADYEVLGDVICFDTTYWKLNDGNPFGLLVGVNNHKRTTIFGVALLYDETAESFVWLFRTFLAAMSGKNPQTILTDEDV
jgi:zinc finger SWIM domain-containing protein 3